MDVKPGGHGAAITVKVTPRSKRTAVLGTLADGSIKIAVAAPPEDGKANAAVIAFLADRCGVSKGKVLLLSGDTARRKRLHVIGITAASVVKQLAR